MVAEQNIYGSHGGKKRKMRGGQCKGPGCDNPIAEAAGARGQAGGAPPPLTPASLSGVSFDQMGNQLAKTAHNLYVQKNYELAALKNVNAMKGGRRSRRRTRRTAKKYSRSSSRKSGGGLVEAVVPLGLLAAQQTLFKRGSSKRYNKYGGSTRRSPFKF